MIVVVETVAVPVTLTVHAGCPWTPPAGMSSVQVADVPDSVRTTVPVSTTEPNVVRVTAEPDAPVEVLVRVHVMAPGPDESDADPVQMPVRSVIGTGSGPVGVDPLHAPDAVSRMSSPTVARVTAGTPAH